MEDLREYIGNWATETENFMSGNSEEGEESNEKSVLKFTPSRSRGIDVSARTHRLKAMSRDHDNPNYIRGRDGLSPLRSPLNGDQAKPDSTGRSRYGSGRSHNKERERRRNERLPLSPEKKNGIHLTAPSPPESQTMLVNDSEDGTPVVSKALFRGISADDRHSSRRRLNLPEGSSDDEENTSLDPEIKEDKITLARREKQIQYGKNTDSYKQYISSVPKNQRCVDRIKHPRTPMKMHKCSRRNWDAQVKAWKKHVHQWAGTENCTSVNAPSSPSSTATTSSDLVENKAVANEQKPEEDDESFLEGFNFEFDPDTDMLDL